MKLLYFAWVRERIGKPQESIPRPENISTISQLADYLEKLDDGYHQAFKNRKMVRVALNQNHVEWNQVINDGDEIAFFPPVTGG